MWVDDVWSAFGRWALRIVLGACLVAGIFAGAIVICVYH